MCPDIRFIVIIQLPENMKVKTIKGAGTVSYTNKNLKKRTTYKYKVRAYKTSGKKKLYGSFSTVVKMKVK